MALLDPTNETDTAGDDGFSSTANVDNVRNARINDLADQVKRGMKATKNHVSPTTPGPSSGEDVFCSSPPRVPDNPRNLGHMAVEMANEKLPEKCDSDSNDEFGDFDDADIDMDFLEKIDEIERIASTAPRQPQANTAVISQAPQTATPASDDFNEFGMDDDIFCGDEFESFISQFDTQTQACQAGEAKKNVSTSMFA